MGPETAHAFPYETEEAKTLIHVDLRLGLLLCDFHREPAVIVKGYKYQGMFTTTMR